MRHLLHATIPGLFLLSMGCATPHTTGQATENGEALYVDNQYRVLRQGESRIDEVDYYTIAGEQELAQEVVRKRRTAMIVRGIGYGLIGVGVAAAAAGYFLTPDEDPNATLNQDNLNLMLYSGGALALIGGGVSFYSPTKKALDANYIHHDFATATQAGDAYNTRVGAELPAPPEPVVVAAAPSYSDTSSSYSEPAYEEPAEITIDIPQDAESMDEFLSEKSWTMVDVPGLPEGVTLKAGVVSLAGISFFVYDLSGDKKNKRSVLVYEFFQELPVTLQGKELPNVVERHKYSVYINGDWVAGEDATVKLSKIAYDNSGLGGLSSITFVEKKGEDEWSDNLLEKDEFLGKYGKDLSSEEKTALRKDLRERDKALKESVEALDVLKKLKKTKKMTLKVKILQGRKAEWYDQDDTLLFTAERSEY